MKPEWKKHQKNPDYFPSSPSLAPLITTLIGYFGDSRRGSVSCRHRGRDAYAAIEPGPCRPGRGRLWGCTCKVSVLFKMLQASSPWKIRGEKIILTFSLFFLMTQFLTWWVRNGQTQIMLSQPFSNAKPKIKMLVVVLKM